eukprot:TRINITY_DN1354_c0_g1_i1.p1 TRINITY_DN1354_c0_g1~~TRINITY_DN1354_c0_g1_i1.p1  ORF type:complete len:181 (+),score=19.45 TRINITY_DN1354_c0_g1_i1:56-598(+)
MLYWFRWLWCMIRTFLIDKAFAKPCDATKEWSVVHFICTPFDCDEYLHMNNCSYFHFMEFGRRNVFGKTLRCIDGELGRQMRTAVAAGHYIRYRMSIMPFQRFQVHTKVVATRGRTFWFEQRFVANGKVVCQAINKTTLIDKSGEMYKIFGLDEELVPPRHVELFSEVDQFASEILKKDI